jgi:hypothetical protein
VRVSVNKASFVTFVWQQASLLEREILDVAPARHQGSKVTSRMAQVVVVLALCLSIGAHWAVLQSVAFRGEPALDTSITSIFLGPHLVVSSGKFSGELAAEFPLSIDNTALQAVPDYRLRASFGVRF